MHKITKRIATIGAAAGLAAGFIVGPTAIAGPDGRVGGVQVAEAAQAGSWLPLYPKTRQPVGWGDTCAIVTHRYWWGGRYTAEYRWFTTSLGTSTCSKYRIW